MPLFPFHLPLSINFLTDRVYLLVMKSHHVETQTYETLLIIISSMIFGATFMYIYVTLFSDDSNSSVGAIRTVEKGSPLIKPLLAYSNQEMKSASPLKKALKNIVDTKTSNDDASVIAIYYRDLNTGRWFGINQDETFVPASLFKVPLLIAYLKDADKKQSILSEVITNDLTTDENKNETIKPLKSIVEGNTYTVEQLLSYMIEYSDNNATVLLFKHINQSTLKQVFSDLDIQLPKAGINTDFISVHNYSFLFRVLYNGTYLSHQMSERGLELLSKIDFADGLRKSIPTSVTVADKFGEYYLIQNGTVHEHQLHDCGIIYHPKNPYILCVMTKGTSLDSLKQVIQSISKTTYSNVDSLK